MSDCTVEKYLVVLQHELIRHDMAVSKREAKHGRVNIYRMGLLMEALARVRAAVGSHLGASAEDKAVFLAAMYNHFEQTTTWVKKVVKQLEAGTCKIK